MEEHSDAKHAHIDDTNDQIIDKVPHSKSLDKATGTRVSEHSLTGGHVTALAVNIHDPQSSNIDHNTLNKRDNMNIPIQPSPGFEILIGLREDDRRKPRRDDRMDDKVEEEGSDHLMDVLRQSWTVVVSGIGLSQAPQPCWWWWEGVQHRRSPLKYPGSSR